MILKKINLIKAVSILTLSLLMGITLCCRSDDKPDPLPVPEPEVQILAPFLAAASYSHEELWTNDAYHETGLEFSSSVKGEITQLMVKIPDVNPALRITIWDAVSKTVLRSETMNITAANTVITKDITDFALQKDKKYTVTMYSNDWTVHDNPGSPPPSFPLTPGFFTIYKFIYGPVGTPSATQIYPNGWASNWYMGDLDFSFKKTE